jgi:hypothetical protein
MFIPTAGGLTDWTVSASVVGYSTPQTRGVANGTVVSYVAESADKTQWETGRGTYNAGVVPRTTVFESSTGGTKVNFTVPPFVWLDAIAQDVGNITLATRADIATTQIPAAVAAIQTQGYSVVGDGGGATYVRVVSNPNIGNGGIQSADLQWWSISSKAGSVNVLQFGAVGDDSTDNLPFFNSALAYLKTLAPLPSTDSNTTPRLIIPTGKFFLNGTWQIHQSVYIQGVGGSRALNPGTGLRFPVNTVGITFHERRTLDNGGGNSSASSGLGDAQGSTLEGVVLWGGGAGSFSGPYTNLLNNSTSAYGIWVRTAYISLIDCAVVFFAGGGYVIEATAGSSGSTAGNANLWFMENCVAQFNSQDGFTVFGSDANAGCGINLSSISNAGAGVRDYSFLGNTWLMIHSRDDGIFDPNAGSGTYGNPTASCLYLGVNYYVVAGQETAASTTTPGTNSAVWAPYSGQGGASPTWVTGKTWIAGGPYLTNPANVNSRSAFFGCYSETAQPAVQVFYPCIFWGGFIDVGAGLTGTGTLVTGSQDGLSTFQGFKIITEGGSNEILFGGGSQLSPPSQVWWQQHSNGAHNYRVAINVDTSAYTGNVLQRFVDNSKLTEQWGLADDTGIFGPNHHFILDLRFGGSDGSVGNSQRLFGIGAVSDLNGTTVHHGDIYPQTFPVAGLPAGWVTSLAGTVGSGAVLSPFGLISNDTSGNAWTIPQLRQGAPNTQTGSTYAILDTDASVIFNAGGTCTVTLPSPGSYTGRWLTFRTIANQTVVSAGSNVVPLAGGAAGTAILAATAGKWADLQSDGSNWQIMRGN